MTTLTTISFTTAIDESVIGLTPVELSDRFGDSPHSIQERLWREGRSLGVSFHEGKWWPISAGANTPPVFTSNN